MKRIKKIIVSVVSIVLVVALVNLNCAFALNGSVTEYRDTFTYWVKNPDVLENLFDIKANDNASYKVRDRIIIDSENNAEYFLSLSDTEIIMTGCLEDAEIDSTQYKTGTVYGSTLIKGILCSVCAVLLINDTEQKFNVGLSIIPDTAKSLDDCTFLGIGDIVTIAELNSLIDTSSLSNQSNSADTTRLIDHSNEPGSRSFVKKQTSYCYFTSGVPGYAEKVELWYNSSYKRATVAIYSYTDNVANYYTSGSDQLAWAYVNTLKIGLRPTTNGAHSVDGFYDFPEYANPPTNYNIFNNTYISNLINVVASYLKPSITSIMLNAFAAVLGLCRDKTNASTTWLMTGSNTYVDMNYAQTLANHSNIRFNDAPMSVSFDVKAGTSGTYSFTGYTKISYFVIIVDTINDTSTTLVVTAPQVAATSSDILINNNQ